MAFLHRRRDFARHRRRSGRLSDRAPSATSLTSMGISPAPHNAIRAPLASPILAECHAGGATRQREVSAPARHLHEAEAAAGVRAGNSISTSISSGSAPWSVARRRNRGRRSSARRAADCARNRRAERQHDRRQFRCRIGVGKVATQRAAVADLRMRDMRQRFADQRQTIGDQRIALKRAVAGERADPQRMAVLTWMPDKPLNGLMSMMTAGCASRKFIVGTRLWPPARNRASSPCSALSVRACSSEAGAMYLNGAGFMACAGQYRPIIIGRGGEVMRRRAYRIRRCCNFNFRCHRSPFFPAA